MWRSEKEKGNEKRRIGGRRGRENGCVVNCGGLLKRKEARKEGKESVGEEEKDVL